ncbi:peptidase A4 family-domain-containing protein [Calycina marina]|uniref:Peptidase A4 family-domain-containing protein n=1 Tax=Calycina marina TaxID=1763456 RepID=A0A9P7Z7S7_9HELO|nr:peptidase A4 family-domain-containing protein [Calycina marina]
MKFTSALLSSVLLASSVIAAPGTAARRARRAAGGRFSKPNSRITKPVTSIGQATNDTEVSYSGNWAGAVLVGTGYTSVTGTFTVPTPTTAGSGSAWVGIDGDTCSTAILQTGIDWTKSGSSITYDAWYEWYPDYAYDFSGITLAAGNSITVTVTVTSSTAGVATIKNNTTGKSVTHTFTSQTGTLCEYNAEWIVEDYESNGSQVTFANFGTVTFSSASAVKSGTTVDVTGAEIIDMELSSGVVTSVTDTASTVVITYV